MKRNMKFYNIKKRIYSGILALTMFATSFTSLSMPVMADNSVDPGGMPIYQGNDVKYFPATFYDYYETYNGEFRFGNSWASHMQGDVNSWTESEAVRTGYAKDDITNGFGLNKSCDIDLFTNGDSYQMPFIDEGNGYYSFDSNKFVVNTGFQQDGKLALIDYSGDFYNAPNPENNTFNQEFRFCPFSSIYYENGHINMPYPNYFFGMKFGFDFIMPKDGQLNGSDMTFTFKGDDDVWIYVDNKLALDLGGIHSAATGTINFATGDCYVNNQYQGNIGNLTVNQNHTLVMYYLERGGSASNYYIRFAQPNQAMEKVTTTYNYVDEDGEDQKTVPGEPIDFPTGGTATIPPSPLDDYDLITVTFDGTPITPNNDGSTTVNKTGKVEYYYVRNVYKVNEVHTYKDTTLGTSEDANKNSYRFYKSGNATTNAITEYNNNKDYELVDILINDTSVGTATPKQTFTSANFDAKRTPITIQYIYERASKFNYTEKHEYYYNGELKYTDTKADKVEYTTETKTANADYTDNDNMTYVLTDIVVNGNPQSDLTKTTFDFVKQNAEIIYKYELYEKKFQVIHKYKNENDTTYSSDNIDDSGLNVVTENQKTNAVLNRNGKNYELKNVTVNDKPGDVNNPAMEFDIKTMDDPTVVVYEYSQIHALNVKHYFEGYDDPEEWNQKFTSYTESKDDPTLKNDGNDYVLVKVVVNGQDDPNFNHGKTYKFYDKDGDPTIAYYYERVYKVSEKHVYNNATTGEEDGTNIVKNNDNYHGIYTANVNTKFGNNEYKLVSVTLNGNDVTDKNATSYTGKGGDLDFVFTYERVTPFNVTVEKIFYDDGYPESSTQHLVDSSSKKNGPFTDPQTYNTAKTGKTTKDGYTDKTFELTEVIVNNKSYKGSDIKNAYTFDDKMGDSKITYIYTYKSVFHVTETHYYYNRSEEPELVGTDKVAENKEYDSIYKAVPRTTYNKVTYTLYDVKVNGESIDPDLFKNGYEGHEFEYIDNAKIEFFYEKTDDYSVKVTHTFRDTGKEIDIESNSSDVPYTKPITVSPLDNPKSKVDGYTDKTFELIEVIIDGKTVDKNDWKKSYDVAKGKPETIEFVYGYETKFALTEKHNYSNISTGDNYITTVHAKENYTGKITSSPIPVCEYDNKTYVLVKITVEYADHPEDNMTIEDQDLELFKNQTFEKENATINFYYELDEHFKYSVVDTFVDHGYSDGSKDFSEKRITDEEFLVSQKVKALTNPVRDSKTYVLEKILVNGEEVKTSDITITINDLKDNKVTVEYVYGTKTTFDVTEVHHYTNKSTGDKNDDTKNINDFEDTYTSKPQPKNPEDNKTYTLVKVIDEDGNIITDEDKLKDYERKFDHKSGKIEYFYELDEEYTITEIHTYNDNGYGRNDGQVVVRDNEKFYVTTTSSAPSKETYENKEYTIESVKIDGEVVPYDTSYEFNVKDMTKKNVTIEYIYSIDTKFNITETHVYNNVTTGVTDRKSNDQKDYKGTYTSVPQPEAKDGLGNTVTYKLVKVEVNGEAITDEDALKNYSKDFTKEDATIVYTYEYVEPEHEVVVEHVYNNGNTGKEDGHTSDTDKYQVTKDYEEQPTYNSKDYELTDIEVFFNDGTSKKIDDAKKVTVDPSITKVVFNYLRTDYIDYKISHSYTNNYTNKKYNHVEADVKKTTEINQTAKAKVLCEDDKVTYKLVDVKLNGELIKDFKDTYTFENESFDIEFIYEYDENFEITTSHVYHTVDYKGKEIGKTTINDDKITATNSYDYEGEVKRDHAGNTYELVEVIVNGETRKDIKDLDKLEKLVETLKAKTNITFVYKRTAHNEYKGVIQHVYKDLSAGTTKTYTEYDDTFNDEKEVSFKSLTTYDGKSDYKLVEVTIDEDKQELKDSYGPMTFEKSFTITLVYERKNKPSDPPGGNPDGPKPNDPPKPPVVPPTNPPVPNNTTVYSVLPQTGGFSNSILPVAVASSMFILVGGFLLVLVLKKREENV